MNDLEIIGQPPLPEEVLQHICALICSQEAGQQHIITLTLVDDGQMRELNRKYRGKDEPTDVLSFNSENMALPGNPALGQEATASDSLVLCDIIIDIKQLNRQKGQNTLDNEFCRVFIHGMLHVLGYDHTRLSDAKKMKEKEDHYLNMIQGEI